MYTHYIGYGESGSSRDPILVGVVVLTSTAVISLVAYATRYKEYEEDSHTDRNTTVTEPTTVTQTAETPVIGDIAEVID